MLIQQGKVLLEIDDEDGNLKFVTLNAGDSIHLLPMTRHRLKALEDTILFEVSTPELDDVTRMADDYGRAD